MAQRRNLLSLLSKVDPDIAANVRLEAVPGGFVNLTGLAVDDQIAALLSYGPRFLMPEEATVPGVFSQFGELHNQIERHLGLGETGPIFVELLNQYKEEKDKLFAQRQPSMMEVALRQAVLATKEFFRLYPHVCIVQSDKGNRTCLMLLSDYQAKMDAYVQKCIVRGVYRLTTEPRVIAAKNMFHGLRKAILASPLPTDDMELRRLFDQLRKFGNARLPSLYGNVKCHKPDTPVRPICSTVAWYSRPIQKLLYCVLRRHFSDALCRQNVKCLNTVAEDLAKISPRPGYVFVKLDVTDMYGSMDKTRISMLLDRLLDQVEAEGRAILPTDIVKRMVQYSLRQSCLIGYGTDIYVQLRGLPQGACDSGFLATIYLDYILQLHHEELFVAHRVTYWAKYMDDFLLYMPKTNIEYFKRKMEYLTGLGFEIEPEEDVIDNAFAQHGIIRTIPFLDISIHTVKDGTYLLSNYRKPTASQRMIHSLSNTIHKYKVNTVHGFLSSLFCRTSTELLGHDLNVLYGRILMNSYSQNFIECIYYQAITDEESKLRKRINFIRGDERMTIQKRKDKIDEIKTRLRVFRRYKMQFSLEPFHHYQNVRQEYVATSRQPGYRFPYRSVSLSRLVFTACQYANMPPPVYYRADDCDVFRKFLGHKRIQEAMKASEEEHVQCTRRTMTSIGMLRCLTCGKIFIISGKEKLKTIVEQDMRHPGSEIYQHQSQLQHTISPVIQVLRPVVGVDTAYLCQLYLAIYHTMGFSTSDRYSLSSLPTFVRTMLGILRGAVFPDSEGPDAETWLTRAVPYLPRVIGDDEEMEQNLISSFTSTYRENEQHLQENEEHTQANEGDEHRLRENEERTQANEGNEQRLRENEERPQANEECPQASGQHSQAPLEERTPAFSEEDLRDDERPNDVGAQVENPPEDDGMETFLDPDELAGMSGSICLSQLPTMDRVFLDEDDIMEPNARVISGPPRTSTPFQLPDEFPPDEQASVFPRSFIEMPLHLGSSIRQENSLPAITSPPRSSPLFNNVTSSLISIEPAQRFDVTLMLDQTFPRPDCHESTRSTSLSFTLPPARVMPTVISISSSGSSDITNAGEPCEEQPPFSLGQRYRTRPFCVRVKRILFSLSSATKRRKPN